QDAGLGLVVDRTDGVNHQRDPAMPGQQTTDPRGYTVIGSDAIDHEDRLARRVERDQLIGTRMSEEIVLPLQQREMRRSFSWHLCLLVEYHTLGTESRLDPLLPDCADHAVRGEGLQFRVVGSVGAGGGQDGDSLVAREPSKPREAGNDRGRARDEQGSGWFEKIALGVDIDKDLGAFEHEPDSRADKQWMNTRLDRRERPSFVVPLCNGFDR